MRRSGPDVLSDINGEAAKIRERIQRLTQKISEENTDLEQLRQEEAAIYLKLAEIRFELLDDAEVIPHVSEADQEAKSYLSDRQKARNELDAELVQNQKEQTALEQKRKAAQEKLDSFAVKVKAAENKTLDKLAQDPAHQAKIDAVQETEAQIVRIENKIVVAKEDYDEKVVPYQEDPLFMYLWECGYGTSKYNKGSLSRMMDKWVAGVCKFEPARRNYAMLSSIPEKLDIHKTQLQEKIAALEAILIQAEQDAFQRDGVTNLQQQLKTRQASVKELDDQLQQLEARYHAIIEEKDKFSSNTDQFYSGAIQKLNELYQGKSLYNLRRNAAVTATKEDDELVRTLFEIEDRIDDIEEDISEYQSSLRQEEWKLQEIQNVRQTFKDKKYDGLHVTFRDGNMFTILLGQFVTGLITNAYFWNAVGRLFVEVLDELDLDDAFEDMHRSHSSRRSRSREKSRGGFRTGGRSGSKGGFRSGGRF